MLTVDHYAKIRLAHRDGMSVREIARVFHHSRRKVREVLTNPQPTPYARTKPAPSPVLGAFMPSSTASSAPTRTPRRSSGTPPCNCIADCATSTVIEANTILFAGT